MSAVICQSYKVTGDVLFKQAAESVVFINSDYGLGSGVIISDEGHIITNYHVIEDLNDDEIYVYLYEGVHNYDELVENYEYYSVEILSIDKSKDLALLQLEQEVDNISPILFAYDEDVKIGSQVFAIGHPTSEDPYLWSFTEGIVNRIALEEWSYAIGGLMGWFFGEDDYQISANVITTQTPINSGNSGGLLMNSQGNLVGINTYSDESLMNVSGAIALDEVVKFLEKNDFEFFDIEDENNIKNNFSDLVYNFEIYDDNQSNDEGFGFNTVFENNEALIQLIVPGNKDEVPYIGIDLNNDLLYDVVLFDVNDDDSFSFWEIDLDNDGEYEWSGDINLDRKKRSYRRFSDKIDIMLIETFTEIENLGLIP
tara:strand:+ start:6235 stop:7341 length:1107 start_codon:yes stop_codon:yes gene_type:complete